MLDFLEAAASLSESHAASAAASAAGGAAARPTSTLVERMRAEFLERTNQRLRQLQKSCEQQEQVCAPHGQAHGLV